MDEDILIMKAKELKRLQIIRKVLEKLINQQEAAETLRLSDRQVRRIVKRVRAEGNKGVIHRLRGRPSCHRLKEGFKNKVIALYQKHYKDFGPLLASEKMLERDRVKICDETLRLWLMAKTEATGCSEVPLSVQQRAGMIEPRPRPEVTVGTTSKILTGCGNLYVTINNDENARPFEVFMQMGKAGGCAASQLEAIGRLVSLALRSGVDRKTIVEQLRGIRCPVPSWDKGTRIFSCADAVSRVLEKRLSERIPTPAQVPLAVAVEEAQLKLSDKYSSKANMVGVCPDCGSPLHHEEGCLKCHGCGFSRC